MGPVSREGWLVVWSYVASMLLGGLALAVLAFMGQPLLGFVILLVLASTGMTAFLSLAYRKGDKHHTVDDYRAGRVVNQP